MLPWRVDREGTEDDVPPLLREEHREYEPGEA